MCFGGVWTGGSNFGAECKAVHSWLRRQNLPARAMAIPESRQVPVPMMGQTYQIWPDLMALTGTHTMIKEDPHCENQTFDREAPVLGASLQSIRQGEITPIVFGCKHFNDKYSSFKITFVQWITPWRPLQCYLMRTEWPTCQTNPWCSWMTQNHIGQYLGCPPLSMIKINTLQNLGLQRWSKRAFPKTRRCTRWPILFEPNAGKLLHGLHLEIALHDKSLIRVRGSGWDVVLSLSSDRNCLQCIGRTANQQLVKVCFAMKWIAVLVIGDE